MKNSIFNAVCKTRYLALLVLLIFTCGNAWGAATLPVNYEFNDGKNSLPTGVTQSGLGSDYAASNAPYRLKFDGQGDYIQIEVDAAAAAVTFGIKNFGTPGSSGPKFKVQGSADGSSFSDIQQFTVTAAQNKTQSFTTTNTINSSYRYFRIYKSQHTCNVGLGTLAITKAAVTCTVAPTVGADLTSVSATVNSITATVPISAIGGCNITENGLVYSTSNSTPTVGGTGCTKVTVTACGSTAANKTVTISDLTCGTPYYVRGYATNTAGTSYTNVTTQSTSACPTYTVTLKDDNTELEQATAGASVTLPSRTGCDGYKFAGWTKTWTEEQDEWTTTAPTIIPAGSYTPTADENLYPVYTKTEGGGSPETVTLYYEPFTGSAHSTGVESTNVAATTDMFVDGSATVWSHYSFDAASTAAYANNYGGETISDGIKIKREANNTTVTMMEVTGIKISGASDLELSLCNRRTAASATLNISYKIDDGSYTAVGGTISYNSTNDTWKKCTGLTISGTGTSLDLKIELVVSGNTNRTMVLEDIKITGETGGSTTYYISVPSCCEDIVTLATNSPANGSITFSPSGPIATCGADAASRQTTMTVTPDAGYYLSAWSTTGVTPYSVSPAIAYGSVSNSGAQATTVTFNQNTTTGTYTANATFTAIPVSSLSLRAQQTGQSDKTGSDLTMNCYPKEGQTGGNDPLNHTLNVAFYEVLPADALDKTYTWSVRVKASGAADWTNVDFNGNQLNTNAIINYYNNNTGLLKIGTNEGTAEIKITANDGSGVTAKVTITVANVSVSSISVDPTTMDVYAGQKKPVTITFSPANATDKVYTTGSYTYVTMRSSGSNPFYIEGNATNVVRNEIVTVTSHDGSKTATIDVTVNPLPKATFIDIVHGKTDFLVEGESVLVDGTLTSTVSADGLTVDTEWHTPTHADVAKPATGNNCEKEHLHLVGWILKDWADANPTATHSDIIGAGATNFYGANEAIDLSSASVNGKTYYAVWAKVVTTP